MTAIAFPTPDPAILARREDILAGLARLLPRELLISTEDERRAFETDGLTAYRRLPLAVALPETTEQVAAVHALLPCRGSGRAARRRHVALGRRDAAGGRGRGRRRQMNRVLEIDYANRAARVQAGVTNLAITEAVRAEGFFYAPDPSSQLACTIAGNIGMNSGGAHCLKYGVTTNNVLGVRMVMNEGEVVDIGGEHLDSAGYDLLGLITGSEGQLGLITEATVRILRAAGGRAADAVRLRSARKPGPAWRRSSRAGIIPVAIEFMDKPGDRNLRGVRPCRLSARRRGDADHRGGRLGRGDGRACWKIVAIAKEHGVTIAEGIAVGDGERALIWKGRKSRVRRQGRIADYICMDGTIPTGQLPYVLRQMDEIVKRYGLRSPMCSTPATATCIR